MKKLPIIITAFLISLTIQAQDITGDWNGILQVPGMQLRLIFHIAEEDQGLQSTLDSPDQNAKGIPVSQTHFENSRLTIKLSQLGAVYEGTLGDDDKITGTFTQRGQTFPLNLSREIPEKESLNRPQEPTQPYPYYSEEVHFPSQGNKIRLAGTLTLPDQSGNFPVAILISGSGPQDRDEAIMTHKPFLVLADHLTRNGIAVLRYDDRGVAESTGDHMSATSMDFAEDVQSAVDYLKSRNEINKNQIGLIGHSEGGLIAPIVAAKSSDISYIVLLAGPGVPGDQILLQQTASVGQTLGLGEAEIEQERQLARRIFDIVKGSEDQPSIEPALRNYLNQVLQEENASILKKSGMDTETFINMQVAQCTRPWFKFFLEYDPSTSLKKVKCPVLAVNGAKDVQVHPGNLQAIRKALIEGGNRNITIKEFPDMNHLFQECESGAMSEYATIEQTFSPVALSEVSNWVLLQARE